MYHALKKILTQRVLGFQKRLIDFNQVMNSKKRIKNLLLDNEVPKLSSREASEAKSFFKSKGYNLKSTDWHAYFKSVNGEFHKDYIPLDIFKTKISPRLNQRLQWPALLDKNLSYNIFSDFEQPKRVVQNINGFYYVNDTTVTKSEAIKAVSVNNKSLIIKPSLDSGKGRMVTAFTVEGSMTSYKDKTIESLFELYKKDFIVQEFLKQSIEMSSLNPSSLNTLRVMSYLNNKGTHILSTTARMGSLGSSTDNYSTGGILCGVKENGQFKSKGYIKKGMVLEKTFTGVNLGEFIVPNYDKVVSMVKQMHVKVPYFKIISWDIALNHNNLPVMVEYNTYNQGLEIQIPNGPLFGEFTDEILAMGLNTN